MKLIITIDTEEDNWTNYSRTNNPVRNINGVVALQELFDQFSVRPTYLVSYPVATTAESVSILKEILDQGKCEIGLHCHPWNTPPFDDDAEGAISERETMMCNLPEELQYRKLCSLQREIANRFGVTPVSFRAGRWGVGPGTASALRRLGVRNDTSVCPFVDWSRCQGPDFSNMGPETFRFSPQRISERDDNGPLLEVPVTVGFLQPNFRLCHRLTAAMEKGIPRKLHLLGVLDRSRLLNKVWLSPELAKTDAMIALGRRMERNGYQCLNMSFHSNSLLSGLNPFVKTVQEQRRFLQTIRDFLAYARKVGWESQTLADFGENFTLAERERR